MMENLGNFAKLKKTQTYSLLNETKAAFAERTKRYLRNVVYRYMEDHGYKYSHKLSQVITTLKSKKNLSDRFDTIECQKFRLVVQFARTTTRIRKPEIKTGDRVGISKKDLLFKICFEPQSQQKVSEIVAFYTRKPPANTMKDEQDEKIFGS